MVCAGIVAQDLARAIELGTEGAASHAQAVAPALVVLLTSMFLQTAAGVDKESRRGVQHVQMRQQSIWPYVPSVPTLLLVRAASFQHLAHPSGFSVGNQGAKRRHCGAVIAIQMKF